MPLVLGPLLTHKLVIKIDENDHDDTDIDYETKTKEAKEDNFGGKFIRIDPGKEDFDIHKVINEIFRHIKQSSKDSKSII